MADDYHPKPEHRFSFGLWTVGNPGRDAFGNPVRKTLSPVEIVQKSRQISFFLEQDATESSACI